MDPYFESDDIKLIDLIRGFRDYSWFIIKRIYIVILSAVALYYGGRWFAESSDKQWVSHASFNAIDARSSGGMGGLMSLASSLGFGVGGGSSNDVLSGIFTSRNVVKSSFLTDIEYEGRVEKIGNLYLESIGYMNVIRSTPGFEKFKLTAPDIYRMTYKEDSILSGMYDVFIEDGLEFEFDPMTGLIKGSIYTPSRIVSMRLAENMLRKTQEYYSIASNEKAQQGYIKLKFKVDSLAGELRAKNLQMATLDDRSIFNKKQEAVTPRAEIMRDLGVLSMQYNDAINSLEAAKSSLSAENQVVRVIDDPLFSTQIDQREPGFWGLIGLAVGIGLSIIVLCIVKATRDGLEEEKLQKQSQTSAA
jgi:hypothetical protein